MPPRDRDGVFHRAERTLGDATITFENGRRLEVPEIQAMSIELDEPNAIPITRVDTQEATFSAEGCINLDIIEEMAKQHAEANFQSFVSALARLAAASQDSLDAMAQAAKTVACEAGTSFMDALNALWESIGDDFELADEEEYVVTDPISFDELMGGVVE